MEVLLGKSCSPGTYKVFLLIKLGNIYVLYAHHHVMSITWVYHSNDQIFVLIQGTGEWGKQEWVPQISYFISNFRDPEELSGEAAPTSSGEGPQGSPWSCFRCLFSEFSSLCTGQGGRKEMGRLVAQTSLYSCLFFFPPKPPCGPSGGQDSLCQVVGAHFLRKKLI